MLLDLAAASDALDALLPPDQPARRLAAGRRRRPLAVVPANVSVPDKQTLLAAAAPTHNGASRGMPTVPAGATRPPLSPPSAHRSPSTGRRPSPAPPHAAPRLPSAGSGRDGQAGGRQSGGQRTHPGAPAVDTTAAQAKLFAAPEREEPLTVPNYGASVVTSLHSSTGSGAQKVVQLAPPNGAPPPTSTTPAGVWSTNPMHDRGGASCVLGLHMPSIRLRTETDADRLIRTEHLRDLHLHVVTDQCPSTGGALVVASSHHPSSGFVPIARQRPFMADETATGQRPLQETLLLLKGSLTAPFLKVTVPPRADASATIRILHLSVILAESESCREVSVDPATLRALPSQPAPALSSAAVTGDSSVSVPSSSAGGSAEPVPARRVLPRGHDRTPQRPSMPAKASEVVVSPNTPERQSSDGDDDPAFDSSTSSGTRSPTRIEVNLDESTEALSPSPAAPTPLARPQLASVLFPVKGGGKAAPPEVRPAPTAPVVTQLVEDVSPTPEEFLRRSADRRSAEREDSVIARVRERRRLLKEDFASMHMAFEAADHDKGTTQSMRASGSIDEERSARGVTRGSSPRGAADVAEPHTRAVSAAHDSAFHTRTDSASPVVAAPVVDEIRELREELRSLASHIRSMEPSAPSPGAIIPIALTPEKSSGGSPGPSVAGASGAPFVDRHRALWDDAPTVRTVAEVLVAGCVAVHAAQHRVQGPAPLALQPSVVGCEGDVAEVLEGLSEAAVGAYLSLPYEHFVLGISPRATPRDPNPYTFLMELFAALAQSLAACRAGYIEPLARCRQGFALRVDGRTFTVCCVDPQHLLSEMLRAATAAPHAPLMPFPAGLSPVAEGPRTGPAALRVACWLDFPASHFEGAVRDVAQLAGLSGPLATPEASFDYYAHCTADGVDTGACISEPHVLLPFVRPATGLLPPTCWGGAVLAGSVVQGGGTAPPVLRATFSAHHRTFFRRACGNGRSLSFYAGHVLDALIGGGLPGVQAAAAVVTSEQAADIDRVAGPSSMPLTRPLFVSDHALLSPQTASTHREAGRGRALRNGVDALRTRLLHAMVTALAERLEAVILWASPDDVGVGGAAVDDVAQLLDVVGGWAYPHPLHVVVVAVPDRFPPAVLERLSFENYL